MRDRKAIVLMMTLGFIAVITALILWSVSISKSRFDKVVALEAENQFSIIFKDFTKLIDSLELNNSDILMPLIAYPPLPAIAEEKTKIGFGFDIESYMDKLNINYIINSLVIHEANVTNPHHVELLIRPLNKFFSFYELSSPEILIDFFLDTIDKDDFERASYSEIATENFDFRQGKIYDFNHFKKIREYYYKSTQDENIFKITKSEFEAYFYFGEPDERLLLDCDGLQIKNALSLIVEDEMLLTEDPVTCSDTNTSTNPNMEILNKLYNISQFANNQNYLIKCIINLVDENSLREISFDYEVKHKRISNIDKNFQE